MAFPQLNLIEYTVSELSAAVKRAVEDGFSHVRVRGEISGFRGRHSSGHCYFALKDDRSRIEACIWRLTFDRLRFKPQEGLEVVAVGRLSTFPGQSKYQLIVDALEPAGVGALMALVEERRRKLAAEGLFDERRKRPLPYLPRTIGVVTSPTGAVIRDILHRLADRFPVDVLVWPVKVQGETSADEVAAAIHGFNRLSPGGRLPRPDVIIVARGGGSLEDLWGFNEEIVVRAAAGSAIPLISAVGHDTDWTLIDHAADRRAPTPTGAAEMAVPVRSELVVALEALEARRRGAALRSIESKRRDMLAAARALPRADDLLAFPRRLVDDLASRLGRGLTANAQAHRVRYARTAARLSPAALQQMLTHRRRDAEGLAARQRRAFLIHRERLEAQLTQASGRLRREAVEARIAEAGERLGALGAAAGRAVALMLARRHERIDATGQLLRSLSYRSVLARGFALVRSDGRPLHRAAEVGAGRALDIEFADGRVTAVSTSGSSARRTRKAKRDPDPSGSQGSLF